MVIPRRIELLPSPWKGDVLYRLTMGPNVTVGCQPHIFSSYLYCFSEHLLVWSPVFVSWRKSIYDTICLLIRQLCWQSGTTLLLRQGRVVPQVGLEPTNFRFWIWRLCQFGYSGISHFKGVHPLQQHHWHSPPSLEERYLLGILSFCDTSMF